MDFYQLQSENRRKSVVLVLIFIVLTCTMGLIMDVVVYSNRIPVYTLSAFGISLFLTFLGYRGGDKVLLASIGAVPLVKFKALPYRRAMNVVSEISLASGISLPEVFVIDEDFPNAMTVGANPERAKICLTRGLVESMTREELQGVVAHEFAHIRSRDTLTFMIIAITWGSLLLLANWFLRFGLFKTFKDRKGYLKGARFPLLVAGGMLALLSPIIARMMAMAVSRRREYLADAVAVELTRNPLGLAKALKRIKRFTGRRMGYLSGAHMFIADPLRRDLKGREGFFINLFNTHPPLERRIEILAKMSRVSPSEISVREVKEILLCPGCGHEMKEVIVRTSAGSPLKLDQCLHCGGLWFDRLELFSLGSSPDLSHLKKPDFSLLLKPTPPPSGDSVCPHCGVKLKNLKDASIPSDVRMMRCPTCGGLWINYVEFKIYLMWRKEKEGLKASKEKIKSLFLKEEKKTKLEVPSRRFGGEEVQRETGSGFNDIAAELIASIFSQSMKR